VCACALSSRGVRSLSAQIIAKLTADCYECLICFDRVKRHQSVWTCKQCYALFHIGCVADWCESSAHSACRCNSTPRSRRSLAEAGRDSHEWRCPACQVRLRDASLACVRAVRADCVIRSAQIGLLVWCTPRASCRRPLSDAAQLRRAVRTRTCSRVTCAPLTWRACSVATSAARTSARCCATQARVRLVKRWDR
jgi:hypothetical protein